jgi:molecular chaperone DnaJ
MAEDPYHILGLSKDVVDKNVIKSAYRKMALKFHPDKNPDSKAAEEFSRITAAYKALTEASTQNNLILKIFSHACLGYRHSDVVDFKTL